MMRRENMSGKRMLPTDFFGGEDVLQLAHDLIGKRLVTVENDVLTAGIITETEAYAGIHDKASHAYGGRKTNRTQTMFEAGGIAYIYLCYGIHSLFNIVTNQEGIPDAILIRALQPDQGLPKMQERTAKKRTDKKLTDGPGKLAKAMGLHYSRNGMPLNEKRDGFKVWVEEDFEYNPPEIHAAPRIGVDYAGDDAKLPYRFYTK